MRISVFAVQVGVHPQTLRAYERAGLITPPRTSGGGRRYTEVELRQLVWIRELLEGGVNVAGVKQILKLREELDALHARRSSAQSARATASCSDEDEVPGVLEQRVNPVPKEATTTPTSPRLPVKRILIEQHQGGGVCRSSFRGPAQQLWAAVDRFVETLPHQTLVYTLQFVDGMTYRGRARPGTPLSTQLHQDLSRRLSEPALDPLDRRDVLELLERYEVPARR